ncbi:MAG: hypothetical protein Ct9H90mP5_04100 [Acidimicrobiaceae bacterium]|nr:MAG: hypothetical protein Ct9H90mP5_04100 [Acidimicrobiaceae bacterium]
MTRVPLEAMGIDKYIASRTPMRRVGEAEEVTNAVIFLASDLASYITAVDLLVDGGTNAVMGPTKSHQFTMSGTLKHPWSQVLMNPPKPRPDWYQALEAGIPGLHYPLPEE